MNIQLVNHPMKADRSGIKIMIQMLIGKIYEVAGETLSREENIPLSVFTPSRQVKMETLPKKGDPVSEEPGSFLGG
jgi:hypothetical protein